MSRHWPAPGQNRTALADWADGHPAPDRFFSDVTRTFCAWTRVDSALARRLPRADTPGHRLRLTALLALIAREGCSPVAVQRTRDFHDYARGQGVRVVTDHTYRLLVVTLAAALRDHGVPPVTVTEYCAEWTAIGPDVTGEWAQRLHPWLRPKPGYRQLRDSAYLSPPHIHWSYWRSHDLPEQRHG